MTATAIDPSIAALLEEFPVITNTHASAETLEAIRAGSLPAPPLSDAVERVDHVLREDPYLRVRVHRLKGADQSDRPCVYSIHGGGYVAGSIDFDDGLFDILCQKTGCVGLSVDYRLAPESAYPAPLEDCYDGLAWVFGNADSLGIDPTRIGIHGISAGGGLAAALALMVRDRGEFDLAYQLLDCPMLDDRQITASSSADGLVGWTRESNAFGWRSYLGDLYGTEDVPYLASPGRAQDLSGLPPAYICVGGADGFRDESIAYALRLGECGVPCELHVYPGAPHGVMLFASTDLGGRYVGDKEHWLTLQVETAHANQLLPASES